MLDALRQKLTRKINQTSEAIFATEEEQNSRMDICRSCDKITHLEFCSVCNCYMPAKTKLAGQSCPLKKWTPIERDSD